MNCKICKVEKHITEYYSKHKDCKDCYNKSQKCIHNVRKSRCKECKGTSICIHNVQKQTCTKCNGNQLCEHKKQKTRCKKCNGGALCKHNKEKYNCKECKGTGICEHKKQKRQCIICDGNSICIHKKQIHQCKDCKGSSICEHNINKSICKKCKGTQICEHNKQKQKCIICSPNSKYFCKKCKLFSVDKRVNYLCSYCNPDKPTRQKTKEIELKTFLEKNNYNFEYNKHCIYINLSYFPDFQIKYDNFYIIIECDEYAHNNYDKKCEKIRENNICIALNLPCVFIRFNPDNKKFRKKINIKNKYKILKSYINYYINKKNINENITEYLFY